MYQKITYSGNNVADFLAEKNGIEPLERTPLSWLRNERLYRKFEIVLTQRQLAQEENLAFTIVSQWDRGKTCPSKPHRLTLARVLKTNLGIIDRAVDIGREMGKTYFALMALVRENVDEEGVLSAAFRDNPEFKRRHAAYQQAAQKGHAWIAEMAKRDNIADEPVALAG